VVHVCTSWARPQLRTPHLPEPLSSTHAQIQHDIGVLTLVVTTVKKLGQQHIQPAEESTSTHIPTRQITVSMTA
jgi:hypothetical protein